MASIFNLLGTMSGTAVAATIGKGLIHNDPEFLNIYVVLAGLVQPPAS